MNRGRVVSAVVVAAVALGGAWALWPGEEAAALPEAAAAPPPESAPPPPLAAAPAPGDPVAAALEAPPPPAAVPEEAEAADEPSQCELIDGVSPRSEPGDVLVRLDLGWEDAGTLTVNYVVKDWMTRRFPDGGVEKTLRDFGRARRTRVTQREVTLRHCGEANGVVRLESFRLELEDGRGAHLNLSGAPSQPVRLTPRAAAEVRGRLVLNGSGVRALVSFEGDRTFSGRDGTFRYHRFPEAESEADVALTLADERFALVKDPLLVRFGPGLRTDLGDLPVRRLPGVKPGKVGLGWDNEDGAPVVARVISDTPAQRAGLRAGDVVVEVDGIAIATVREAMQRIPGQPGIPVRLKVRRGADFLLFDLVRQESTE